MYGLPNITFLLISLCLLSLRGKVECDLNDEVIPEREAVDVWTQPPPLDLTAPAPAPTVTYSVPAPRLDCERPPVYFCEEPPDTIPPEVGKTCNYRGQRYHAQVYRWVAGRGCLFYTPDFLYVGGANTVNLSAGCYYGELFAPCLEIAKEDGSCGCFPFDPGLQAVAVAVREALLPAAHGRWERCFYAAADCCAHYMADDSLVYDTFDPDPSGSSAGQCPTTFDGWTCWLPAEAGTVASEVCSEFAYSGQGPSCDHYSTKECFANGTWQVQTEYGSCSVAPRLLARYRFHVAALAVSIVLCLPAVVVFCFYRRLRVTRVALHRNLLIAIIVRNVLVIVTRTEIYIDELTSTGETAMTRHGVGCRVLAAAERAAASAVFSCMLVEGLYLHRLIAAVFKGPPNVWWLYFAGAVIALAPVAAWAGLMGALNDHSCWAVYSVPHVQWVLDAPRLLVLLVNAALLGDILRVLCTKLRNSENANQLSTAKATMYLMPIFGSQFLLTALRPRTADCALDQAYYCLAYGLEALQGFLVALFYCYINKEVHMLIKATYKKTENAIVSRVRRDSDLPRGSVNPPRLTCSTALPTNEDEATAKENTTATKTNKALRPKLHVAEIISIQASERLAEILDPVYETVEQETSAATENYDALDRSAPSGDSGGASEYYGFTNASSVSIDCQDWIRCVSSPTISAYDSCEVDPKLLEKGIVKKPNVDEMTPKVGHDYKNVPITPILKEAAEYDDCGMLDEILEYIDSPSSHASTFNPELLCPCKEGNENVTFIEEESRM